MKHSIIKIIGQPSMLIILIMLILFSPNGITAQENEVVTTDKRERINRKIRDPRKPRVPRDPREHKVHERDVFTDMKIEHKGDIRVSDDDKRVISISSGGYLKIYKKTFGNKRGIEIKSENGKLNSVYYSGNKKLAFEPEGSEWLAEILPEVIRKTGIDAERRAKRIYQRGGVSAVL